MLYIAGRKIKIVTGTQSQTVRVMTSENIDGRFDYVFRLLPPVDDLEYHLRRQGFASIEDLCNYLRKTLHAQEECTPVTTAPKPAKRWQPEIDNIPGPGAEFPMHQPAVHTELNDWEREAITIVEGAIDELVSTFIQYPYLHRVEHSLHCELYLLLMQHKLFSDTYPLERTRTRSLHKEWPEWRARPEKGNRRGNFDLVVLSPETLAQASVADFRDGRLEPLLAVEFGLDYSYSHLASDDAKLTNSAVQHGYLIHLARENLVDDFSSVERLVLTSRHKVAYAHITYRQAAYKLLADKVICHEARS